MKCPQCENLYPSTYKTCIYCEVKLVRERFIEVKNDVEIVETISPLVECGELKIEEF